MLWKNGIHSTFLEIEESAIAEASLGGSWIRLQSRQETEEGLFNITIMTLSPVYLRFTSDTDPLPYRALRLQGGQYHRLPLRGSWILP
jgi:hypothetical protein